MKYSLRSLMTFSIRDIALVTVIVALAVGWGLDHQRLTNTNSDPGVPLTVRNPVERVTMVVETARVIKFPFPIARTMVDSPAELRVIPLSPTSVQAVAQKTGIVRLAAWSADGRNATVVVAVVD